MRSKRLVSAVAVCLSAGLAPSLLATPAAVAGTTFVQRVALAKSANFVDVNKVTWLSSRGLSGSYYTNTRLATTPIAGTNNDKLYQGTVNGLSGWATPVPSAGRYTVRLHLVEGYWKKAGARVFNVTGEGKAKLGNVDIYRAVGFAKAYTPSFTVDVTDGTLNLGFAAVADRPEVAAVEVTYSSAIPAPSPVIAPSPSPTTTTSSPTPTATTTPVPTATTTPVPTATTTPVPTATTTPAPTATTTTSSPAPTATTTPVPTTTTTTSSPAPTATTTAPVPTATTTTSSPAPQTGLAVPVPATSFWRTSIRNAPLATNSADVAANLANQVTSRWNGVAAVNAYSYNVSFYEADASTPKYNVEFYDCQGKGSAPWGLYSGAGHFVQVPIPDGAVPAVGSDGTVGIYDRSQDKLWELWKFSKTATGYQACWGGRLDSVSTSNGAFPDWFGVSATSLSMSAGMISLKDVRAGHIDHAMYLAVPEAENFDKFSWPAQRSDGWNPDNVPNRVLEGQRVRLDPSINVDALPMSALGKMIAKAAQEYGFIVSDTAGSVAVITESGQAEAAATGKNPWDTLLGAPTYEVLRGFPWSRTQVMPKDYGKPSM